MLCLCCATQFYEEASWRRLFLSQSDSLICSMCKKQLEPLSSMAVASVIERWRRKRRMFAATVLSGKRIVRQLACLNEMSHFTTIMIF